MIELQVIANFESVPDDQSKKEALNLLSSYILEIEPSAVLKVDTGEGCWWIVVAAWVGEHFLGWLIEKGFDRLANSLKDANSNMKKPLEEEKNNILSNRLSEGSKDEVVSNGIMPSEIVNSVMSQANELQRISGGKEVTFTVAASRFNSSGEGVGYISSVNLNENSCHFSIVETITQKDFDNYIKQKI